MTQIPGFTREPAQLAAGHDVLRPGDELERARSAYVGGHAMQASQITQMLVQRLADVPGTEATEVLGSAHTLLGLARRVRGEPPEEFFAQAVRVFERLPADQLGSIGATMADYGIALQETGEHTRAVAVLDRALELGQDTPDVRRYRAAARRDRGAPGDHDAAYRLLEEAVRRAPGDWQAWGWLAEFTEAAPADPAAAARCWAQAWQILDEAGTFGRALRYRERAVAGYRSAVAARPDDAKLLIEAARALAEAGLEAEAADLLSQVAELPIGVEARLDAAELLIDIGEHQFAADLANDVLAENPGSGRATVILAMALFRRDDVKSVELARRGLTDFLRTRPSDPADAEMLLGEVCHRSGHPQEALAHFDTALASGKLDDVRAASLYADRGRVLLHLGRTADGVADLRRAAALRPRDAVIRLHLADAYRETGDRAAEIAQLQEVVDWTPGRGRENWVEAATRLGAALLEHGERERALAWLRRIPDPEALATDVLRPLTDALLEEGREKEALDALVDAERRSQRGDLNVLALHARVLYQLRQLERAKELLKEVLAANATRWRDRAWLGEVHRLSGEPEEALHQLDQVLHDHPGNPFSLSSRAAVHLSRNEPGRAEADLERSLTSDPTDPFALKVLHDLLIQRRDYAALVDRYRRAARSANAVRAPTLWLGYGSTLRQLAACGQAADIVVQTERELTDDLATDPCDTARLRALSDLLVVQGRISEAIDRWQRAVDTPVGKSDARLWGEYGEVLRQGCRYGEAQEALDTALWLADEGYTPHVYHAMGRLLLDQSRYEEAIGVLDQAYRDPRDPAAWYDGCVARILADRIIEVAGRLHGWSREHPDAAEARWLLGWLYYHTGAYAEAAEQAGEAVDHDPLDGRKQELLGWSLLRGSADLEGARSAFERALELEPALYSSKEGRIRVLLQSGRSDEARAECEELLATTEGGERETVAPAVRASCLARLGEPLRAVSEFRKALPEWGADRVPIEFSIAFSLLQAGHDEDARNTMEQAWSDLEAGGRPDEDDRRLQRRGILTEVLQDMPDAVPPGRAGSGGELLESTRRTIADELRHLPAAAAITMDDFA